MLMQGDQHVGGEGKQRFRLPSVVQQAGKGVVAKILEQQEALLVIVGKDGRRAEVELNQSAG